MTRLEDGSAVHTLHGHYGTVTALFVDRCRAEPATAGSGSAEGTLSVWDLTSGGSDAVFLDVFYRDGDDSHIIIIVIAGEGSTLDGHMRSELN